MKKKLLFEGLTLLSILFLIVVGSLENSARTMKFPWILGGIVSVLLLWEMVRDYKGADKQKSVEEKQEQPKESDINFLKKAAMMLAILPTIYVFGFLVGLPLHVFFFIKYNGEKWLLAATVAISVCIFYSVVLYNFMDIPFYQGLLFSYFVD